MTPDAVATDRRAPVFATHVELLRIVKLLVRARTYLEIGVETGYSLFDAPLPKHVIGVDPTLRVSPPSTPETEVSLFEMTSDEFFARNVSDQLVRSSVDVTFVDGLHHAEYVWRDIMNAERLSTSSGVILVHDICPRTAEEAGRTQCEGFWMGDVFKVLPALRHFRPDLDVVSLKDVPPSGMAIISGLKPSNAPAIPESEVEAFLSDVDYSRDFATRVEPMMVDTVSPEFIALLSRLSSASGDQAA